MRRTIFLRTVAAVSLLVLLAACQNSEEQAEEHFQNAMALMAEGDTARASVEFRNVFQNNGFHEEARENFAAMLRREGEARESYSQYLRLVEQVPDHVEGRIALAEMALAFQNWEEARRHGARAVELAPDHPAAEVIALSLAYLDAVDAEDDVVRDGLFEQVMTRLEVEPENPLLQRVAIDGLLRAGDLDAALAMTERVLAAEPQNRVLHDTRLQLLAEMERAPEMVAALREMMALFPEDEDLSGMLLRFLIARGDIEDAGNLLRDLADDAADDTRSRHDALQALVQLQLQLDGAEGALAELSRIIEAEPPETQAPFRILRAALNFETGARQAGRAELEGLLAQDISPGHAGQARVALARMMIAQGDIPAARALIEQVVEDDPGQVEALKLLAAWLIEEDEADRAISRLRSALDARPDDADAMTLMAQAHARNGNRQLAREFLSLAVEASRSAPEETIRYARVLLEDGRDLLAEELVVTSLRTAPGHPELLSLLGDIYLRMEDWSRADQVEGTLRNGDADMVARADQLRTAILAAQGQTEAAIAYLEDLAASEDGDLASQIAVIRARVATGDGEGALNYTQDLLEADPGNPALKLTLAAVFSASGRHDEAEAAYREIITDRPDIPEARIGLIRSLHVQGRGDDAQTALDEALVALPNAPDLLWAQAGAREQAGDFEEAIAIYERLYEVQPNQLVIANNLASLISTYRDDPASLERADVIARRLRGSNVPQFRDTYGWIAYRQGNYDDALDHLEPAAVALSDNPLVQFHLGMTYLALDRRQEALEQLRLAVDLAGETDSRPQFVTARAEIAALEAVLEQENTDSADE